MEDLSDLDTPLFNADQFWKSGEHSKALAEWATIRKHFPDHPAAYIKAGDAFASTGQTQEAKSLYRQIAERDPHNIWPLQRLAAASQIEGSWPAMADFG